MSKLQARIETIARSMQKAIINGDTTNDLESLDENQKKQVMELEKIIDIVQCLQDSNNSKERETS